MKRPTAMAAVFGLFLAGVVSGLLGAHLFYAQHLQEPKGPLWFMGHPPLRHLAEDLELTPEQWRQVEEILRDSRQRGEDIRREIRPQLHQLMEETHERLVGLLTPEQQEKFESLRFHRHYQGERRRGPGRGIDNRGKRRQYRPHRGGPDTDHRPPPAPPDRGET